MDKILDFFGYVGSQIRMILFTDVLDILLLSLLLFFVYRFMRERRAGKLAVGVVFLLLILVLSQAFHMYALRFVLQNVFQVGILALIILFQPELRAGLEKVASEPINSLRSIGEQKNNAETLNAIRNICEAADSMSRSKTGALIVIERGTKLGDLIRSGVIIDADVNKYLIGNIFFNKAPLHDGAMIIRNNRVYAAGCLLPLTQDPTIDKSLGTRHRAAIGASEVSDALVVVVSEETGIISVACDGKIERNFNSLTLQQRLSDALMKNEKKALPLFLFKKEKKQSGKEGKNGNGKEGGKA